MLDAKDFHHNFVLGFHSSRFKEYGLDIGGCVSS